MPIIMSVKRGNKFKSDVYLEPDMIMKLEWLREKMHVKSQQFMRNAFDDYFNRNYGKFYSSKEKYRL